MCGKGGSDPQSLWKIKKWLYISLEILVRTPSPLEKHMDPWGPIATRGGQYDPLWNTLINKKKNKAKQNCLDRSVIIMHRQINSSDSQ